MQDKSFRKGKESQSFVDWRGQVSLRSVTRLLNFIRQYFFPDVLFESTGTIFSFFCTAAILIAIAIDLIRNNCILRPHLYHKQEV